MPHIQCTNPLNPDGLRSPRAGRDRSPGVLRARQWALGAWLACAWLTGLAADAPTAAESEAKTEAAADAGEKPAKAGAAAKEGPRAFGIAYGTVDLMLYRFADSSGAQRTWNLNGIRDTVLGIKSLEAEEGNKETQPVWMLEAGFGADRGERGREYTAIIKQFYVGASGPWGQFTVGKQYNVMTNIAWSTLNPISNGWGVYFNDLLYFGDPFGHGNGSASELRAAGADWFLGYQQRGAVYQYKGENYSLQADFMPGAATGGLNRRGASTSLGGTLDLGKLLLAGAVTRQAALDGQVSRQNQVLGGVYTIGTVKVYLSRLQSAVSAGARYNIDYGGVAWQVTPQWQVAMAMARYRQNDRATFGSGQGRGWTLQSEYALTPTLNLYVETDFKRHVSGSAGNQLFYATPGIERNFMIGFNSSF